jgi:hypothetical protein
MHMDDDNLMNIFLIKIKDHSEFYLLAVVFS